MYADGEEWNCLSESGESVPELKQISTKAAFAWWVLYNDPYTETLLNAVKKLHDKDKGWYSGQYETTGSINKSITANTNGIILECLNYKLNGPLVRLKVQ